MQASKSRMLTLNIRMVNRTISITTWTVRLTVIVKSEKKSPITPRTLTRRSIAEGPDCSDSRGNGHAGQATVADRVTRRLTCNLRGGPAGSHQ